MRIRALVQARLKSERFPAKVLEQIGAKTVLEHIAERLETLAPLGVEVIFAIADEGDSALADYLIEKGHKFYQGDARNVLKRYADAAADLENTDFVIRCTGDNPFVDKDQLASLLLHLKTAGFDYGYTADLPLGMGAEVIRVNALRSVIMRAFPSREGESSPILPHHSEHVTTYIRENPHLYDIYPHRLDTNLSDEAAALRVKGIRLTIDEKDDIAVCRRVFEHFNRRGMPHFGAADVIQLAKNNPEMLKGNESVIQKSATSSEARKT